MAESGAAPKQLVTTGLGAGILASSVLAAITLVVFYVLQDYGPESALRKYNEAVISLIQASSSSVSPEARQAAINQDYQSLDRVSAQPHGDPYSQWLGNIVVNCLRRGGRLRLIALVGGTPTDLVAANAAYVLPDGTQAYVFFYISRQDHVWKVDARQTFERSHPVGR
jgi:hypothetical protein